MTAPQKFRRRAEIVEAVQFDGSNEKECSFASGFNAEVIRACWRIGEWALSQPAALGHLTDADFRSQYEPVPVPSEWVPVTERLPEPDGLYLAYVPDGRMMIFKGSILEAAMRADTPMHLQFQATHWMPLPQAPGGTK